MTIQFNDTVSNRSNSVAIQTAQGPIRLRKFQVALAKVMAGTANARIAFIGDSTMVGAYADGVNAYNGNRPSSPPLLFQSNINKRRDIGVTGASLFCDAGTKPGNASLALYDTRVQYGVSWFTNLQLTGTGGKLIASIAGALGSAADETLTFTPIEAFDTVDVYWRKVAGNGTFTIDVGGAVLATCAGSGTEVYQKTTVTKAASTGLVNLIRTATGSCFIGAIVCYNSTVKEIEVYHQGYSGSSSVEWSFSNATYSPINSIPAYSPDLTFINLGLNDTLTNLKTYETNLTAVVNAALTTGDVVLVLCTPREVGKVAVQEQLRQRVINIAYNLNVPYIDLYNRFGSIDLSPSFYNTDNLHLLKIGYQDVANAYADFTLG